MVYVDLLMGLNFAVDLMLLIGVNGISGFPNSWSRLVTAAVLGGAYGGICIVPGFRFLAEPWWRIVFLILMAVIAFGWNWSALRRGALFVLLSMALGGIAIGLGRGGVWELIGAAAGMSLICVVAFHGHALSRKYTQVTILHRGKRVAFTALFDTGNTLRDPITGESVLVVGADIAKTITGLTMDQLNAPIETMASNPVPGLRLIPYRAVGQPGGMLLALRMDKVWVGNKESTSLVAFAPQIIGNEGYQALAGGIS